MLKRSVRIGLALTAILAVIGCGATPTPATEQVGVRETTTTEPAPTQAPEPTETELTETGPAALSVSVADGATVAVDTLITVTPNRATVTEVEVTTTASGKNAAKIDGAVNDRGVWVAHTRLDPGASYTVTARGSAKEGNAELTARSKFRTNSLNRNQEVFPTLTPIQGGPFGVAQPVIITFDLPVADKAEFERNMHVTSTPAQEGSWGWISDTEVHFRPKEYWQAGTKIHLNANLNGVSAGNGTFGQLNRTLDLTIGRHQTATVDLASKQLTFTREGQAPQTFPVSAGKEGFTTRSGHKVIMEKMDSTRMDSETTGIANSSSEGYNLQVAWALRVTSSGEFFHAAPWNEGKFGQVNASHGCVGMSTSDAYKFYEQAQIGDPVEFTGSDRETEFGNGWSEWNLSWPQWQEKSAL